MGDVPAAGPDAASPGTGALIEWYRPDLRRRLYRAWLVGSGLVTAGSLLGVMLYVSTEMSSLARLAVTLLAVVSTASGPAVVLWKAFRVLSDETVLVLGSVGLSYTAGEAGFTVPWNDVDEVVYDAAADALVVRAKGREHVVRRPRFVDVAPVELVERIRRVRRRALMGLI
jgi:hypothetical protein